MDDVFQAATLARGRPSRASVHACGLGLHAIRGASPKSALGHRDGDEPRICSPSDREGTLGCASQSDFLVHGDRTR